MMKIKFCIPIGNKSLFLFVTSTDSEEKSTDSTTKHPAHTTTTSKPSNDTESEQLDPHMEPEYIALEYQYLLDKLPPRVNPRLRPNN